MHVLSRGGATGFVTALSEATPPIGLANPYRSDEASDNLRRYLELPRESGPKILFVGEAPGHRGAVLSGVPFAAVGTLTAAWRDPWGAFGPGSGFKVPSPCPFLKEATATTFWESIALELPEIALPLTWNAVPFHPLPKGRTGNRTPTASDLRAGSEWLLAFVSLFQPIHIVAVGRRAEASLRNLDIVFTRVRHPSHGGRREFKCGLRALRRTLSI